MDVLIANYLFQKNRNQENFTKIIINEEIQQVNIIALLWVLIASAWAAGISWKCNSGLSFSARLFYAVLSSLFSSWYLLFRYVGVFCPNTNIFQ